MMRKKLLISVFGGIAAAATAACLGMSTVRGYASTDYGTLIDDDFEAATLDTGIWNAPSEGSGVSLSVSEKSVLTYDLYHGQSISTKNPLTVADSDCLVIEFDMLSNNAEGCFWSVTYGSDTTNLNANANNKGFNFYGDSSVFYGTSCTFPTYNAEGKQSIRWIGWKRTAKTQILIHADGSSEIYQGGMLLAYVKASDATEAMKARNGYLGLTLIGSSADVHVVSEMSYFKVGTFAETEAPAKDDAAYPALWYAVPGSTAWTIDDSAPTKEGMSDLFVSTQSNVGGWILKNNYIEVASVAGSLVSKAVIPEADARIGEMFALKAFMDTTGLGSASVKLSFGGAAAGIAPKDDKYYLTVWDGETVVAEKEVVLGKFDVSVEGYGDKTLEISYNGVTVSGTVASYAGGFSLDVTAGATSVTLDNVVLTASGGYEHKGGKSVATDFSSAVNEEEWYIASSGMPEYEDSGVSVKDGELKFVSAQTGSMLSTVNEYQNFVFTFDITYLEREGQEDDDGNIVRPVSAWLGVVYGAPEKGTGFDSQPMIYFQNATLDLLNTKYEDGTARKWLTQTENIFNTAYAGKTVSVRLEARDGTVIFSWYDKNANEKIGGVTLYDQDTLGHVSIQCTINGTFSIDNAMIVNTDEVADYTLTKKSVDKTEISLFEGETETGKIELGDMTEKTATFALDAAVEGFVMNADGSWSYTAPATAPVDKVTVNYTVAVDDWVLMGYSPAGASSRYTLNGTLEITVKTPSVTDIEVVSPTKLTYKTGEELNLTGMTVTAVYDNGDKVVLSEGTDGYSVDSSAYKKDEVGTYTIKVTYGSVEKSFTVTVAAFVVTKIEVVPPTKLTYKTGEELNLTGMTVTAVYENGNKVILSEGTDGYTVDGSAFVKDVAGAYTIKIKYETFEQTFTVTVTAPVLTELELTVPSKLTYKTGEELDLTGMKVTAVYDTGSKVTLSEGTDGYTVDSSAYKKDESGTYTIKVTYGSEEKTFTVTVEAQNVTSEPATSSESTSSGAETSSGEDVGCGSAVTGFGLATAAVACGAAALLKKKKRR